MNVLEALTDQARIREIRQLLPLDPPRSRFSPAWSAWLPNWRRRPSRAHPRRGGPPGIRGPDGPAGRAVAAGCTPIEYSICQHAVAKGRPLIVGDARTDPVLHDNPAVLDLGLVAYAGIPLIVSGGHAVGTLCVVDVEPRDWLDDQLAQLALLADLVTDEFELQRHERAAAFRRVWSGVPELASRPSGW